VESTECTKTPDPKTQLVMGVRADIEMVAKQMIPLNKTKKDLLTLIEEDYPAQVRDMPHLLYTKPVTQVRV
jgi:predicted Rossmann fold nucleotide-binding protein DprA/Smf involved in DNA uptake